MTLGANRGISAEIFDLLDDIDIQSTNGGIILYIKSSLNANIEIIKTNGAIIVDDDFISATESSSKYFKGIIGSGGNFINVLTTNGDIKINELII